MTGVRMAVTSLEGMLPKPMRRVMEVWVGGRLSHKVTS